MGCFGSALVGRFQVDVGTFTLMGPLLRQSFTCVSGHSCTINDFTAWYPRAQDVLLVSDTCGTEAARPHITMLASSVEAAPGRPGTAAFSTQTDAVIVPGGAYRLCWSGATGSAGANLSATNGDGFSSFSVDAGELHLIGPSPLMQDRKCVCGETCTIRDITGLSSSDSWMLMVLDTCNMQVNVTDRTLISGFPSSGLANVVADGVWQNLSLNNLSNWSRSGNLLQAGLTFSWGSSAVTAAGGSYRLCWCAELAEPGANQSEACMNSFFLDIGRLLLVGPPILRTVGTCISGQTCSFPGNALHPGVDAPGELLVMDTCGTFGAFLPRFSFTASSKIDASVYFGSAPITALGGQYRLCWCAGGWQNRSEHTASSSGQVRCDMEDFLMDVGAFHLLGPERHVSRTCISGLTCQFQLQSEGFSDLDTLMLLDTCGVSEAVLDRVPDAGAAVAISGMGSFASWGDALLTAAGGLYRLCWCRRQDGNTTQNNGNQRQCALPHDHIVDAGSLLLMGPHPLQQHRTCIAGRPCNTEQIYGQSLDIADSIQLLETCGVPEGTVPYRFPLNGLMVSGPNASQPPSGMAVQAGLVRSEVISAPGGVYRLCWCSSVSLSGCARGADFQTDLGHITVLGVSPLQQDRTCISGRVCAVEALVGVGLSELDSYMILGTCGQPVSTTGIGQRSISSLFGTISWADALTAAGGEYRLCWCSGLPFLRENASNTSLMVGNAVSNRSACSVSWDFGIDVGRLLLLGPAPLSHRSTCAAGQVCVIGLAGMGLSSADLILVQDTCGQPHALTPFPGPSSLNAVLYHSSYINASELVAYLHLFRPAFPFHA